VQKLISLVIIEMTTREVLPNRQDRSHSLPQKRSHKQVNNCNFRKCNSGNFMYKTCIVEKPLFDETMVSEMSVMESIEEIGDSEGKACVRTPWYS
jgi:hypothetical protein